jgi:cell fate (sporulation/competence/biofilm development) regulator YlbF (YheA/YmcA/DUF963 family)
MEQLIEMARRLGRQIAAHERTTLLKKAQQEATADAEAQQIIKDYQKQVEKIKKLESEQRPIEPADKRQLAAIEEKVTTNTKLSELTRRQADFVEMMQKVKKAIDDELQM